LTDAYKQLCIDFTRNFSLLFRVYNEGIAYRWVTAMPDSITVNAEEANVALKEPYSALLSVTPKLTSWELPYTAYDNIAEVADSDNIITPAMFIHRARALKLVVARSSGRRYKHCEARSR